MQISKIEKELERKIRRGSISILRGISCLADECAIVLADVHRLKSAHFRVKNVLTN